MPVCSKLRKKLGNHFYKDYLLKIRYDSEAKKHLHYSKANILNFLNKFDENGDSIPRYSIYRVQKDGKYKVIGRRHDQLKMGALDAAMWFPICDPPCKTGEFMSVLKNISLWKRSV